MWFSPECTSGKRPSSSARSGRSHAEAANGRSCFGWCLESSQTLNYNRSFLHQAPVQFVDDPWKDSRETEGEYWRERVCFLSSLLTWFFLGSIVSLTRAAATEMLPGTVTRLYWLLDILLNWILPFSLMYSRFAKAHTSYVVPSLLFYRIYLNKKKEKQLEIQWISEDFGALAKKGI